VLALIFILFLFFLAVAVLFLGATLTLKGYFDETPPDLKETAWRAPAAALAVTLFVILWVRLAYASPDRYDSLFDFSTSRQSPPVKSIWIIEDGGKVEYRLEKDANNRPIYRNRETDRIRELPRKPDKFIIREGDREVVFQPKKDAKGKPIIRTGEGLRYYDEQGRYMEEGYEGIIFTSTGGGFVYFLLNVSHFVVWFLAIWLLLRFTWAQALLLALIAWLSMTLIVMRPLLQRVRTLSEERARSQPQTRLEIKEAAGWREARGQEEGKRSLSESQRWWGS